MAKTHTNGRIGTSVRLDPDVLAALRASSKGAGTTVSSFVNKLVRIALNVSERDKTTLYIRENLARAA